MSHEKLIVALDVSSLRKAESLVKALSPVVKIFKVGKELFTSTGPQAIKMLHSHRVMIFLDLKFHDIPHTVGSACAVAARSGVHLLSVHALGGAKMMIQAVQSVHQAAEEDKIFTPRVLAVTVLTSLNDHDLAEVGIRKKVLEEVRDLAVLAKRCGLDGVVASGREIKLIRKAVKKDFLIITPGVRPVWAPRGDQKRIMTPKEALEEGADYIVVGRPITQHSRPRWAAEKILREIGGY